MSENNNRMSEEVADIAQRFMKKMTEGNVEEQRAFIAEISDAITEPNKKVPEPVFRTLFLPYFTGERVPDRENDVIAHWIGIIGSASEPVDIVDAKGEKLFEVPPMVDTSRLDVVSRTGDGLNFSQVFQQYRDEMSLHEQLGNKYLAEKLAEKANVSLTGPNAQPPKHSWGPVLAYYNLVPTEQGIVKADGKATASGSISDDDLDF